MRRIYDEAAVLFTREFYRTFADGYPQEVCVTEARKALRAAGWNWSSYALFSNLDRELAQLRFER